MKARWFAVKSVYRTKCEGESSCIDDAYDANATLVEERVVLFRAASFEIAIQLAEWEAAKYCKGDFVNVYGQTARMVCLGEFDAFELFESPGAGKEAYSRTELVPIQEGDSGVSSRFFGTENDPDIRRRKFFNGEFSSQ